MTFRQSLTENNSQRCLDVTLHRGASIIEAQVSTLKSSQTCCRLNAAFYFIELIHYPTDISHL